MIVVGLTGGIGSGKTTVANFFLELGVPVYIADFEAKKLMNRSMVIKRKLIALFGDEAYINGNLNRPFLADKIFNDRSLLQKMNSIVHPKVKAHFNRWVKKQDSPYVIKEAAILFENGSYEHFDFLITVTADEELRIERVLKRDNTTREKILSIIDNQWDDAQKLALSDYEITNHDLHKTENQVNKIHLDILSRIQ
jgi:dephospho-CoA kinase